VGENVQRLIASLAKLARRGSRFAGRLLRRRSGTKKRVPSLLLTTAARDPGIHPYRTLIGSRVRSQLAYRTSFWLNVATSVAVGLVEFIELFAIMANIKVFGGLDLRQVAFVFALANAGWALAEVIFGQLDIMPTYLRLGRLEVLLIRPMPLMLQLITSDFQLRRLGRLAVGMLIILVVLPGLHLNYTPATVYLLMITPLTGAAIYAAFFVTAGGLQFFLIDGAEFTSSFVYGGSYAGQLPGSVLITPVRVLFTFVFPATVTAYLPALLIMGLPGAELLPAWLGWFAPLFALWAWLLAWLAWRAGVRHFTGAGG
jgi:ABC-2 type transport system permease protein